MGGDSYLRGMDSVPRGRLAFISSLLEVSFWMIAQAVSDGRQWRRAG